MLVWWQKSRYEINYSNFFWGGWRGVLQWCNVRAHKIIISACTIDFRPTLMYQSTSADLHVVYYFTRKGKALWCLQGWGMWHIFVPIQLSVCLQSFATKLGIVVHHHEPECHAKKWDSIFNNQNMTVSTISFILLVLNQWVFCNQIQFECRSS